MVLDCTKNLSAEEKMIYFADSMMITKHGAFCMYGKGRKYVYTAFYD